MNMNLFRPTPKDWTISDLLLSLFHSQNRSRLSWQLRNVFSVQHALVTNLGRTAISLAMDGMLLKKGSTIGIPTIVCQTVINSILASGYEPVILDVSPDLHMHPGDGIPEGLDCVLVPHLYGLSAPIDQWEAWAKAQKVCLIDDAAQAVGLKHNDRWLGTFGNAGIFSFGPYKNLSLLRGGALLTNEDGIAERAQKVLLPKESSIDIVCRVVSGTLKFQFGLNLKQIFKQNRRLHLEMETVVEDFVGSSMQETGQESFQISSVESGMVYQALLKMEASLQRRSKAAEGLRTVLKQSGVLQPVGTINAPSWRIPVRVPPRMDVAKTVHHFRDYGINAERIYEPLHLRKEFIQYARQPLLIAERCWGGTVLLPNPLLLGNNGVERIVHAVAQLEKNLCSLS